MYHFLGKKFLMECVDTDEMKWEYREWFTSLESALYCTMNHFMDSMEFRDYPGNVLYRIYHGKSLLFEFKCRLGYYDKDLKKLPHFYASKTNI